MVGDHNSFDEPILEGKILNARANGGHELKGIMGPISGGYTPEERNELARAGISTVVSVDGKVVIGASLSTAGTSDFTSWHAGRVLRALADLDNCIDDEKWVDQLFDGAKVSRPAQPDWDWTLSFTNLLLVERHSKAAFPIIEGRRGLTTQISG